MARFQGNFKINLIFANIASGRQDMRKICRQVHCFGQVKRLNFNNVTGRGLTM